MGGLLGHISHEDREWIENGGMKKMEEAERAKKEKDKEDERKRIKRMERGEYETERDFFMGNPANHVSYERINKEMFMVTIKQEKKEPVIIKTGNYPAALLLFHSFIKVLKNNAHVAPKRHRKIIADLERIK